MKTQLKILYIKIVSALIKILWIIPVKKKNVLFLSFGGTQISDSPKAIYDDMKAKGGGYNLIWGVRNPDKYDNLIEYNYVKIPSIKYLILFCTSKYIIVNDFFNTFLPVRKSQVLIDTWHGGGWFKKVGLTDNNVKKYDKFFFDYICRKITYFVASSEYFVDTVLHQSFNYKGNILRTGMPRNAIFFQKKIELKESIRKHFNADDNTMLVLYAPTFRNYFIDPELELDLKQLEKNISDRFQKKVIILFRAHHLIGSFPIDYSHVIDVTAYPDMQQLLLACDILVSDYSSCMWDAAIQDKLVIVYAPDAQKYIDNRGFFLDIREWPFLLAFDNKDIEKCIQLYDEDVYLENLHRLVAESKSYEGADAVASISNLIWRG